MDQKYIVDSIKKFCEQAPEQASMQALADAIASAINKSITAIDFSPREIAEQKPQLLTTSQFLTLVNEFATVSRLPKVIASETDSGVRARDTVKKITKIYREMKIGYPRHYEITSRKPAPLGSAEWKYCTVCGPSGSKTYSDQNPLQLRPTGSAPSCAPPGSDQKTK